MILAAPTGAFPARSAPVAQISHAAIRANIAALGLAAGSVVGLDADAFGHGFDEVAALVTAAGLAPSATGTDHAEAILGLASGAAPAMRLSGAVLGVKELHRGEGVSYGYAHRAEQDTRVALVVGGYAQGIVRSLGGRASVSYGGERLPIVGRVAMDVCVVDIGEAAISRGSEVVFFGDPARGEPELREWTTATDLAPLELVTTVGLRAVREHAP